MKFRSGQRIEILPDQRIIAGPIINRNKRVWEHYEMFLDKDSLSLEDIGYTHGIEIVTSFGELIKLGCKINHIKLLPEESKVKLSDQDLVDDLEFMQKEIDKCDKMVKKYKDLGDDKKSEFYFNLVNVNTHTMFQLKSEEEYFEYIKHVKKAVHKKNSDFMETHGNRLFADMDRLSKAHNRRKSFVRCNSTVSQ